MNQTILTERARVRSVDSSFNKETKRASSLVNILIQGVYVPVFANINNAPMNLIPSCGEYLKVNYVIKNHKIIIKELVRRNGNTVYCKPV